MVYKAYDEETLQRLQRTELKILKEFDTLCRENGIRYFGCGGTAIGAVRHGGFIPWDDDIDVGMLRRDYERFLKVAAHWKTDQYCGRCIWGRLSGMGEQNGWRCGTDM